MGDENASASGASTSVPESAATIDAWRRVVLVRAAWLTSIVFVTAVLAFVVQARWEGWELVSARFLPGLTLLLCVALWRKGSTVLRAWGVLGGLFFAIVGAALVRGYATPNAFGGSVLLCVLAALVLNRRMAWLAYGIGGAVWAGVALAFVTGHEAQVAQYSDHANPANWLRVLSIHMAITAAATAAVLFMVTRLERALNHGEILYKALAVESEQRLALAREQHALEARLQHSQRLESLGCLAAGVAHDFNNLLLVVLGNADLATEASSEAARKEALHDLTAAAERASELTRQLLAFSRQQAHELGALDVRANIETALGLLRRLLPSAITLRATLPAELPFSWGSATAIEQIVMNLCINARDAMPSGGTLDVSAEQLQRTLPGAAASIDCVRISVRDTGSGMDEDTQRRIFEPFFTTKSPGQGTGLGLSLVRSLVQQCGGSIELHSERDRGTTFDVYLPLARQHENAEPARPAPISGRVPRSCGQTLLVVDTDPFVLTVLVRTLERAGFQVLQASTGTAGLELFRAHAPKIALVLSDEQTTRPGESTMSEAIVALGSGVPFVACGGYTQLLANDFFQPANHAYLPKPWRPEQLLDRVAELLRMPESQSRVAPLAK